MTSATASRPSAQPLDPHAASLHADRLYRAALRMTRSPHDAEDLTQETYAKVLSRPRTVGHGDELGYLLRALRNTYVSICRSASRRPATTMAPELLANLPRPGGDPHVTAEAHELIGAMTRLPAIQREAVAAVDLLGLTYAEAATALDAPEGTIMSRVHRGRAALAEPRPGRAGVDHD